MTWYFVIAQFHSDICSLALQYIAATGICVTCTWMLDLLPCYTPCNRRCVLISFGVDKNTGDGLLYSVSSVTSKTLDCSIWNTVFPTQLWVQISRITKQKIKITFYKDFNTVTRGRFIKYEISRQNSNEQSFPIGTYFKARSKFYKIISIPKLK